MKRDAARALAAFAAAAALTALLAAPAQAATPYVTPETTMAEVRANEGIVGSGFNTWGRGTFFPE